MVKIVAQLMNLSDQNDLVQTLGKGKSSSWRRNYLSYDSTQNQWSIISLNFFERIGRKVFGLFKNTHLNNVIVPLQQLENLPEGLISRMNQIWQKAHPGESQPTPIEANLEIDEQKKLTPAKTFYTQDSNGQVQGHQLVLDPFRFMEEGLVCLPNPGSRCWIVSFLQVFAQPQMAMDLKALNIAGVNSTQVIAPVNPPSSIDAIDATLVEMNQKIVKIAQRIEEQAGDDPSEYIPNLFSDQITFKEEFEQKPLDIPENSHPLFMVKKSFDLIATSTEQIEMQSGDYVLKGIISYVDGHYFTQIPKENRDQTDWYQCGRFAALSESADPIVPVDEEVNPATTAIIEKNHHPILENNLVQFFVYQKI